MREKKLYNVTQIVPQYKQKFATGFQRTYKGFSTVNTNAKKYSLTDYELIKQDIMNHFNIKRGEKLENPNFGTIIWDAIFEPMTESLKQAIIDDVKTIINYDPRVTVELVSITEYATGIQLECTLKYKMTNNSEQMVYYFDRGQLA